MGDSLAADVGQIVAPDGTATYDFTAIITTPGVTIDAATHKDPPASDSIRWLSQPDGGLVAQITAYNDPVGSRGLGIVPRREVSLTAFAGGPDDPDPNLVLGVQDGTDGASVQMSAGSGGTAVGAFAGGQSAIVLDSTGHSDFIRPADGYVTADDVLNMGLVQARLTWGDGRAIITDGVSEVSDPITHPLGVVPAAAVGSAIVTGDGRDDYVVTLNAADDTTLYFNVRGAAAEDYPLADPTEVHFYWVAVAPYP